MDTSAAHVLLVFPALRVRLYRVNLGSSTTAAPDPADAFVLLRDLHIASTTGSIVAAALTLPPHGPTRPDVGPPRAGSDAYPAQAPPPPVRRASGRRLLGQAWAEEAAATPRVRHVRVGIADGDSEADVAVGAVRGSQGPPRDDVSSAVQDVTMEARKARDASNEEEAAARRRRYSGPPSGPSE